MTPPDRRTDPFDVVVIGAGTAGLVTAAGSATLGARVALIERDRLGGECLWTGCVPSKALLRSAQTAQLLRRADRFGLDPREPEFRFADVMESMRAVIARIQPHDDPERFRRMGVTVIEGTAELVDRDRVAVDGRTLGARRIVIATGSRPTVPAVDNLEAIGYRTHESILDLDRRPDHLLVLGAGPVGLEYAQVFRRLGSDVTVVERAGTVLPREDSEVADGLRRSLEEEGIRFHLEHRAVAAELVDGRRALRIAAPDGTERRVVGDELLVATGMRPNTGRLGLERAGVDLDSRGAVRVDARLRTSARRIWAAGDVTGVLFFTHVADYQARLVVRNMFFPLRARADYTRIPWATYTEPTLARIGLTEAEARERYGGRIAVHRQSFDQLDRAIADRSADGLAKIIVDRRGRILGAHILGPHADVVIHEIAIAMANGSRIGRFSRTVHAYPTMSEIVRKVGDGYYRGRLESGWIARALRWWVRTGSSPR